MRQLIYSSSSSMSDDMGCPGDEATDDSTTVSCIELDDGSLVEVLGIRESSSYNHTSCTIETKCV